MTTSRAIGVDIGGTGIKAGLVDLEAGALIGERVRVSTPQGARPDDVLSAVNTVLDTFGDAADNLPLGVAFPAIVRRGRTMSASNISPEWIDFDAEAFFERGLGRHISFVNDADAAGVAEARHGAAKGMSGLTILTTLGTGIGSAFIHDGVLIPNTELGHLERKGQSIERWAAYSVKEREELSYAKWAKRLQVFYAQVEFLFSPDRFIVGGGVSKHADEFLPLLHLHAPIVPAVHRNAAGIIGAASLAAD